MSGEGGHQKALELVGRYVGVGVGADAVMQLYHDTATQYDQMLREHDFHGPELLADAVTSLVGGAAASRGALRVLDVAAGTGLSGQALYEQGFKDIDALDGSQAMLDEAKNKDVYTNFFCEMISGQELNIPKKTYDLATFSGAFQENHLPKEAYLSIIPLLKSGGHIVNVMRDTVNDMPWYKGELEPFMDQLEAEGRWTKVRREAVDGYIGQGTGSSRALVQVYRVL